MTVTAAVLALKAAWDYFNDKNGFTYDAQMENVEEASEKYRETKKEIDQLTQQLDGYKESLNEIAEGRNIDLSGFSELGDMIGALEQSDSLTLMEQVEIDKIKLANAELETQLRLKEQIADQEGRSTASEIMELLGKEQSAYHASSSNPITIKGDTFTGAGAASNATLFAAIEGNLESLEQYKEERKKLLMDDNVTEEMLQYNQDQINIIEGTLAEQIGDIQSLKAQLEDENGQLLESAKDVPGVIEAYEQMKILISSYANKDLPESAKQLAALNDYFDGSIGKNHLKEKLQEAVKSGSDLSMVLKEAGLTLSDLGIDNINTLASYFTQTAEEAEKANKTVQDYAATVSDVSSALEKENEDKDWASMSAASKTIMDLIKEGKTGTDEVEMFARFINPERVKELVEKDGKYIADAYEQVIRENKKLIERWFNEDETKSMENFVNDFKDKGLFDVTTDDKGLWDIDTKFKSTAEAAKEMGTSVEAVEVMLAALSAYGYNFDNILFSGDALERYQTNLANIKALHESMSEGSSKDALGEMIGNWDSALEKYKEDLDSLSEPQIVQIEFQYDLAQIESELEKLRNRQAAGDELTRTDYAEWINTYDSKYSSQNKGFGLDEVEIKAVTISDDAVEKAREELAKAVENDDGSGKGIVEAQVKLIAAQESRDALLESFNKWNLEQEIPITADSGVAEVEAAWEEFTSAPQVIKIEGEVTNTESIRATLESLAAGSTITYEAKMSDGSIAMITATKDADGNITYTADIDGAIETVEEHKDRNGTVYYSADFKKVKKTDPPVLTGVAKYEAIFKDKKAPSLSGKVYYDAVIRGTTVRGTTGSEMYGYASASGTMLSPAHKDGTAYNILNTLPAYAHGKVGLSEDQRALVNELGMESIVRDGVWRLLPGGAHLENLKKGDIIFNAAQTKDLLRSGKTPGRARAYAQGNVLSPAYRLGNYNDTGSSKTVSTTKKSTKQVEKALEELEKAFDWITVKFERLARTAQKAEEAIERAQTLNKKLSATSDAITAVRAEKNAAKKAAAEYEKQFKQIAKSTGLSKSIQTKIQNGSISMGDYTDKTQEKISKYKEAYDNYLNAIDMVDELSDKERELALQRLDLVEESYNALKELKNSAIELNESRLNLIDAKGLSSVSDSVKAIYQDSLKHAKSAHTASVNEVNKYKAEIDRLVRDGYLVEGTQEYNEYLATLNDLEAASIEAEIAVIEFKDALRDIEFERIQNFIDALDRASNKLNNQIELMEARDEDIPESMYQEQIGLNNDRLEYLSQQLDMKRSQQAEEAVDSDRYKELAEEIANIEDEMYDLLIDNEKLKDSIAETRFAGVNEDIDNLNKLQAEISDTRSMLDTDDFLDDNGNITAEGSSNISLMREEISLLNQEIAKCNQALQELEAAYASGLISEKEYKEMTEQYKDTIRDATKEIDSLEDSIEDLYESQREAQKAAAEKRLEEQKEAARKKLEKEYEAARKRLEKENELLKENIEKRREALQRKADYYDYDRTIRHKEKDINMLKAQIAAMDGVTDAAAMAEKKRLEAQLKEAQDDLEATKHQHAIDMQLQELDDLEREIDKTYDRNMEALEEHVDRQEELIDNMLVNVVDKYGGAYSQINGIIDKTTLNISNSFKELTEYLNSAEDLQASIDSSSNNQSQSGSSSGSNGGSSSSAGSSGSNNSSSDTSKYEEQLKQPENTTNRPVVGIVLDKTSVSVNEGTSKTVKVKEIKPSDAANQSVKWKSSDTKIATVSSGTIKGVKAGSCTVTCTAADGNGASATVSVTVKATTQVDSSGINSGVSDTKEPTKNNSTTSSSSSSSTGDNKITKGEKVTFDNGKYTAASDGSGASGKQKLGEKVYVTKIKSGAERPYHIATKKDGSGALGWVKKSQLKGYAKGLYKATHSEWAFTNENVNGKSAPEIVVAPDGGILTKIEPGSSVIPHNFAQNLFELGANPNLLESSVTKQIKILINDIPNYLNEHLLGQVSNHYDSLLTVNGNVDKDALPGLQEILKQSYQYTSQQLTKDAKKLGIRGIR